jgi:hypothetical protein
MDGEDDALADPVYNPVNELFTESVAAAVGTEVPLAVL